MICYNKFKEGGTKMKRNYILKLVMLCGIFFLSFICVSCKEQGSNDGFYKTNGYYLPVETKGLETKKATLRSELTSSKMVFTEDKVEMEQLSTLFCGKKFNFIGTLTDKEFNDLYLNEQKTKGFVYTLYFESAEYPTYELYLSENGTIFYENNGRYSYTENSFVDYSSVKQFFDDWTV